MCRSLYTRVCPSIHIRCTDLGDLSMPRTVMMICLWNFFFVYVENAFYFILNEKNLLHAKNYGIYEIKNDTKFLEKGLFILMFYFKKKFRTFIFTWRTTTFAQSFMWGLTSNLNNNNLVNFISLVIHDCSCDDTNNLWHAFS